MTHCGTLGHRHFLANRGFAWPRGTREAPWGAAWAGRWRARRPRLRAERCLWLWVGAGGGKQAEAARPTMRRCQQVDTLRPEDQDMICHFLDMAIAQEKIKQVIGVMK
nr:hypothetical protein [Providencia rettgeri]